ESEFLNQLLKQHPDFEEQFLDRMGREYFYLHKFRFLDEDWFMNVFENWQNHNISILGFKEVGDKHIYPKKAKITVSVNSGIDWFETSVSVVFGDEQVALKHIQKAVKNNSRYIQLGDGSMGILPQQWLD